MLQQDYIRRAWTIGLKVRGSTGDQFIFQEKAFGGSAAALAHFASGGRIVGYCVSDTNIPPDIQTRLRPDSL